MVPVPVHMAGELCRFHGGFPQAAGFMMKMYQEFPRQSGSDLKGAQTAVMYGILISLIGCRLFAVVSGEIYPLTSWLTRIWVCQNVGGSSRCVAYVMYIPCRWGCWFVDSTTRWITAGILCWWRFRALKCLGAPWGWASQGPWWVTIKLIKFNAAVITYPSIIQAV